MLNQPSKVDVVDLFICQITSYLYFDELSIFEYSKTEFSFQSVITILTVVLRMKGFFLSAYYTTF